jgi:MFS family permease
VSKTLYLIFLAKSMRTFVFGAVSILVPVYLVNLGYPASYAALGVFLIVLGNVVLNLLLTLYEGLVGRRRFLVIYSMLMAAAGIILLFSTDFMLISVALFIGGISVTGTESGPFQSVEVGVIPRLVKNPGRALGVYNLLGYLFSSLGALSLSLLPRLLPDAEARLIYVLYVATAALHFVIYRGLDIDGGNVNPRLTGVFLNRDIRNLSILFAVDAFGGSLITQSLLALWFYVRYNVTEEFLGVVFSISNVITAISLIIAPLIAEKIGNLRTMVFTHVISNIFLILIPLVDSLQWSVTFLFIRQSFSQMDVPTRQAFIAQIFSDEERVKANAVTNIARNISSLPGPALVNLFFMLKLLHLPLILSGLLKLGYDITIYKLYKNRAR